MAQMVVDSSVLSGCGSGILPGCRHVLCARCRFVVSVSQMGSSESPGESSSRLRFADASALCLAAFLMWESRALEALSV